CHDWRCSARVLLSRLRSPRETWSWLALVTAAALSTTTILDPGCHSLTATFTPTDSVAFAGSTSSADLRSQRGTNPHPKPIIDAHTNAGTWGDSHHYCAECGPGAFAPGTRRNSDPHRASGAGKPHRNRPAQRRLCQSRRPSPGGRGRRPRSHERAQPRDASAQCSVYP